VSLGVIDAPAPSNAPRLAQLPATTRRVLETLTTFRDAT
jgi:hypothetical protein